MKVEISFDGAGPRLVDGQYILCAGVHSKYLDICHTAVFEMGPVKEGFSSVTAEFLALAEALHALYERITVMEEAYGIKTIIVRGDNLTVINAMNNIDQIREKKCRGIWEQAKELDARLRPVFQIYYVYRPGNENPADAPSRSFFKDGKCNKRYNYPFKGKVF